MKTVTLFTMQQFSSILLFYRPLFLWSFGINALLSIIGLGLFPLFLIKFFLVIFLWHITTETLSKRKLLFYRKLGISTFKLFSTLFIIDAFLSLPFLLVLKAFI
ncbi:hypothetical protein [Hyunsoonleella rubra]|uniref:Uncharacterized protein n=1 Tax=Hyunsoonleella rubra TaxID=1737062 RepID=A0ABW5T8M4_9FLAO